MKIIAVSQRVDIYHERNEKRDALDQRLVDFLFEAGYLAVPIPNSFSLEKTFNSEKLVGLQLLLNSISPAGIVLSGGNDIGEIKERDLTEHWLLDYARDAELPVLGICRGMQMMAHWSDTGLCKVRGHVRTRHHLFGEINHEVNSYHDHSLQECPVGYRILARSEDNQIEAIGHQTRSWEGWMWHPEREAKFQQQDINRTRELFL